MKWLRYAARALILVWAGWWTYFGLACGIGEGLSAAGIFMHSLPGLIFLVVAGIAWRWERVGGVVLILIGLLICIGYPVMMHDRFPQSTIIIMELTFGMPPLVVGCLLLADTPRPEAKQALRDLKTLGVGRSVLLTGDRTEVADQIGEALEMDEVIAEVLPEQKLDTVHAEREAGNSVMVVGDGVNDALALATGDVGVALGAVASDVALQSADVALMTNDLGRLPATVRLARRTRATIHQNVLIGAGMSIAFVSLASLKIVSPVMGALLHVLGELFVIGNSARLLRFDQTRR